jgi:hypothetical protein
MRRLDDDRAYSGTFFLPAEEEKPVDNETEEEVEDEPERWSCFASVAQRVRSFQVRRRSFDVISRTPPLEQDRS